MGIISRVTTFVAGTVADPAQVNAELDRIHNEFNGNIDDANVKPLAGIAQNKITNLTTDLGARLLKTGDTMTGPLVLPADPALALQAATKQYTDNGLAGKVAKAGDTMTGALVLSGDPTLALHATTKQYTDAGLAGKASTSHRATHAVGGTDVLTPADIGAAALVGANFTGALQQNGNNVWHAGNDGTASGLDADTLDGVHAAGFLPWVVDVDVFMTPASQVRWTLTGFSSGLAYSGTVDSDGAIGAAISFDVTLAGGTWTLELMHTADTGNGIYTVQLDGAAVGTIDGYLATYVANTRGFITNITNNVTGKRRLTLLMASKNAASSNYRGQIQHIQFRRTF